MMLSFRVWDASSLFQPSSSRRRLETNTAERPAQVVASCRVPLIPVAHFTSFCARRAPAETGHCAIRITSRPSVPPCAAWPAGSAFVFTNMPTLPIISTWSFARDVASPLRASCVHSRAWSCASSRAPARDIESEVLGLARLLAHSRVGPRLHGSARLHSQERGRNIGPRPLPGARPPKDAPMQRPNSRVAGLSARATHR